MKEKTPQKPKQTKEQGKQMEQCKSTHTPIFQI